MKKDWLYFSIISGLVLLAAFSRLVPHPNNFTAIGALAIFSAFSIQNKWVSAMMPLASMWISDLVINNFVYSYSGSFIWFSSGFAWIYLGIFAHTLFSWVPVSGNKYVNIGSASLFGAICFFVLSNFGVWASSGMYPHTPNGLAMCFAAAIPFFGNTLAGNVFFCSLLFVSHYFLPKKSAMVASV